MSCVPVRTNYVRPHAKASYIRPLLCQNEKENMHKDFVDNISTFKSPEFPDKELSSLKNPDFFKSIDDAKEKHIHNLSSAHSKLYAQIDKIQIWTASFESECKKKDKKADELKQTIESQRKVLVDLQMQNENLSTKLDQEIQQRVSVLKNFYFTKELFSTLKKNVIDLQEQFDACSKIKIALDVCCEENAKAVDDLTEKMNTLCVRYSENIVTLNNSLKNEQNNNLMLKKLFEQQNLSAEKEHKSLCKLIENYQDEIKNYAKDLDDEKNKVLSLQQEKNDLLQRIGQLEQSEETNIQKFEDVKKELQLTMESKLETEKKCSLESEKVNNLSKKTEELEELVNKQKNDFDEKCLALKTAVNSLENSLSETNQKLVECESEKEMLSRTLQEQEKEKGLLENEISAIQKENKELQNKLIIDAKISDESISLLMKEKNDLERSITLLKDDLQTALLDKEKLSKMCSEGDKKLSEMNKEYEIAAGKIKELSFVEERYVETLKKVEEMETDMQLQSNLLASKEQEIKEMQQLKLKYDECLVKIKEHENTLLSFSDELKVKEKKINELTISEEKLSKALIKIEELESDLSSKNDLLISKEMKISELTISEEELNKALIKIEEMEFGLSSKNDLLISKELCIEEMNSIKQNYDSAVEKIKEMEEIIKHKTELLQEEEKKAIDLDGILKENSKKLEKLEYENLEMKDCLEKEQGSVKICLECEMLKDKVRELDTFKTALMDKEKELNKQKLQTSHITKMLSETEENFDEMRIKKEKEIIKCKDTIQSLQHELKILKVEVSEVEKVKCENDKLHLTIEEIKLQNAGDIQRLKAEIESLKAKENISHPESAVSQKLSATPSEKNKSEPKKGQVMEPDSSDEVTIIEEENLQMPTMYKKFSKAINRKVINHQIQQSTPLPHLEKRKRAWETESSGSECLEIIFDKNAKKVAGFTPKVRSPYAPVKTPVNLTSSGKISTSEDKRRDILKIADTETPKNDQSDSNTVIHFTTKSAPQNEKAEQITSSENMDFLRFKNNIKETPKKNQSNSGTVTHFATKSTPQNRKTENINTSENMNFSRSKNSVKEVNFATSPWREQAVEIKRTPSTPSDRKFFKTPLKERENSFQKPQLQKLWF